VLETEATSVALSQAISTNSRRHQVIVNGRIMAQGGEADYTLTSTTITFTSQLEAGSRVLVYAYPSTYA
jgi:hypothetical protein